MIEKVYSQYCLVCDICGKVETGFDSFDDAKEAKKEIGWISKINDGEWKDICDDCQKC